MENKFAENDHVIIWTDDQILFLEYKKDVIMDYNATKETLELLVNLCKGKKYYGLTDLTNLIWMDKKSREYIVLHKINHNMKAWAYFSAQPIHKIMFNYRNSTLATEFFTSREDALKWLKYQEELNS